MIAPERPSTNLVPSLLANVAACPALAADGLGALECQRHASNSHAGTDICWCAARAELGVSAQRGAVVPTGVAGATGAVHYNLHLV